MAAAPAGVRLPVATAVAFHGLPVPSPLVGFATMVLAVSKAVSIDIGLIATFGGIGVIVNVIFVMIAIQIRGERRENREYRERVLER